MKTPDIAAKLGDLFAQDLGCNPTDIQCLRAASVDDIINAQMLSQKHVDYFHPLDLFLPWTPTGIIPVSVTYCSGWK